MNIQNTPFPEPYSTIESYTGLNLNKNNRFIKISLETLNVNTKENGCEKKQLVLFKNVIEKLENINSNLKSLEQLEKLNPKKTTHSVLTKNNKLRFESYKENGDESDPLVDLKADIIAAVFYERFKISKQPESTLLAYHRIALANALKLHVKQYFESELIESSLLVSKEDSSNSIILKSQNFSNSVPELHFSDYSDRLNDTNLLSPNDSPLKKRNSISRRRSLGKILGSEESFSGSFSSKSALEKTSSSSSSNEKIVTPLSSRSQDIKRTEKTLKEMEPGIIAKELSMDALNYCETIWLQKHTKEKKYKDIRKSCEEKIAFNENILIKQFKEKPNLGIVSQEIITRGINNCLKVDLLSQDINRTFRYAKIYDCKNKTLYKSSDSENQDLAQFEKFLSIILKEIGEPASHNILDLWKEGIIENDDEANELFINSIKLFLDKLLIKSENDKNTLEYKLWLLLGTFSQSIYTEPCLRLLKSLPDFNKISSAPSNMSIHLRLSPAQFEIVVSNTIELCKKDKKNQTFKLIIENCLNANILEFESWSSKINVRAVPSNWKEGHFKNDVIKPLQYMGFDVREGYSALTLRKKSLSTGSLI
ncbi:MAG: hypothetical protein H0V82_08675 [Candidatus Protochlamydia sp.]|nr:hypothetical protein [Candidatus Protochlamydia sp.]